MLSANDGGFSSPTVSPSLKALGHASFACIALVLRMHLGLAWASEMPEELHGVAMQMLKDYRLSIQDECERVCSVL